MNNFIYLFTAIAVTLPKDISKSEMVQLSPNALSSCPGLSYKQETSTATNPPTTVTNSTNIWMPPPPSSSSSSLSHSVQESLSIPSIINSKNNDENHDNKNHNYEADNDGDDNKKDCDHDNSDPPDVANKLSTDPEDNDKQKDKSMEQQEEAETKILLPDLGVLKDVEKPVVFIEPEPVIQPSATTLEEPYSEIQREEDKSKEINKKEGR